MDWIVNIVDSMLAFFIFMSVATTFFPIPDFPVILNLAGQGWHPAWLIALIGGLGTCVAGLVDYFLVVQASKLKRVEKLLEHRYYRLIEHWFKKIAFLSIVLSGFLVFIPFDPFKLFAATARYNRYKYVAAIFIGRVPRYYLMAVVGEHVRIHPVVLGSVFLLLLAIPIIQYFYNKIHVGRS